MTEPEHFSKEAWKLFAKNAARTSKYRAKPLSVDGIRFASHKEAARWLELQMLERAEEISLLERQVIYPLHFKDIRITSLRVDFRYRDRHGALVLEDVKGGLATITEAFRIKAKWLQAEYGLTVRTV